MKIRTAKIALTALTTLTVLNLAAPAFADRDDWHHDRGHFRYHHEWRGHHDYDHARPYVTYTPGYYYVPPPVAYAPPPPMVALPSLNVVIPLGH